MQAVARAGARVGTSSLEARARAGGRLSRIGLVVPKYGHTAVQRNQLKRRLRELVRTSLLGALRSTHGTIGLDLVLRARPNAYGRSLDALRAELDTVKPRLLRLLAELETSKAVPRTESRSVS